MTQMNQIDVVTTDGCPEVTAAQLLAEDISNDDYEAVERVMGRFNSTTAFCKALQVVLTHLEADKESELLGSFLPTMAETEAKAMNEG